MVESKKQLPSEKLPSESTKFFQAIGLIYGQIIFDEQQKFTVSLEGEKFPFTCGQRLRQRLIKYLETNPNPRAYLRVYPKFNIRTKQLGFKAIGFYTEQPKQTQVNQFLLAGVWQYIQPLPELPVMTIYRNYLRPGESPYNFRINHVPVVGFKEQPYLYNSKSPETATTRKFYELIVSFVPQPQEFQFLLLLDSTEKIPTYVKRKFKKKKPNSQSLAIFVTKMNFPVLQKTASKLRESGFLTGKIAGKGVTKETLTAMIQDALKSHPSAVKSLPLNSE